jgi:alanine dehydrogenase
VPSLPVLDHDAVLSAVSPEAAIDHVRAAFLRFHAGEWVMPAKVYLQSPPYGDFRAMPARGGGLATLKWVTSFPGNPAHGLPTVNGVICVSDASNGQPLMLLDARSVTALRTGAVAAVASDALAAPEASSVGIIGCGLNGAWAARCLAATGYGPGVCFDPSAHAAAALAEELG